MRRVLPLLGLAVLASGCGSALTSERLSPSFATAFRALYVQQQSLVGRTSLASKDLQALSSCRRTGTAASGPGEDWVCTVQYVDAGASAVQTFEVQVKPDGCWKADGPPASQPAQLANPTDGSLQANPLSEFDGCFDTSW
ncbi:MAG: hypothetical protein JWO12_2149 [Frankiales bacterium]|nr:hypothetical protein [Frankiales bacterium]